MVVFDRKPVPIYELRCAECKSVIWYKAAEISLCHITCPVCGFSNWADAVAPIEMRETEAQKCEDCRHGAHWDGVVICGKDAQRHDRTDGCERGERYEMC